MKHKTIKKKLLRYLDNELAQKEKLKVRRHLESCQTCQNDLKIIKSLWRTGQPVEKLSVPPFLWTRIITRLKSEKQQGFVNEMKYAILPMLRPAIIIVVLLFILVGGIDLGNWLTSSPGDRAELSSENTTDNFGLSYFEVLPPGSIDGRILALTESEM